MNLKQDEFCKIHDKFLKENLITEAPHPKTINLSDLCQSDLSQAFEQFKQVELDAILKLNEYISEIENLHRSINECLKTGNKILLIGCGSSGRLAALIKILWDIYNYDDTKQQTLIINISSGGNESLIKAVEQFEDQELSGIDQLISQGFGPNDLLIGLSASGEAPFILSAIDHACHYSKRKPWLIINNPIKSLIIRNPNHPSGTKNIHTLELVVGEMALAGSTRLQATTVMQIVLGIGILNCSKHYINANTCTKDIKASIAEIYKIISQLPLTQLAPITKTEAQLFTQNKNIVYKTNNALLGLTLFADIAERAPTFNITAADHFRVTISLPQAYNNQNTTPQTAKTSTIANDIIRRIIPEDFLHNNIVEEHNQNKNNCTTDWQYHINHQAKLIVSLQDHLVTIPVYTNQLYNTLIYKICLNAHSTLMFGILGYFKGNLMLSVKPSNFKLIDRIIRYCQFILLNKFNQHTSYEEIATIVFEEIEHLKPNQSIVQNVIDKMGC